MIFMANKFWREFYGKTFKGGSATLYVGDRFWNVKMDGWSDRIAFTDGWSKLIEDLSLDTRCNFVFTMVGYKTFELFVFNHETSSEIYFKKVKVIASEQKEKLKTEESDCNTPIA
ncbi:putative transcription factor B3-Domain family [Helianthus annuus]|uniref:Putative DNA-binding pseudobarrel domain-containing protein n=2 Tax=Helianthus annuus TaxID=4232 RepID=A0A251TL23_HELAN|nr:putative transcription factor B3-Domain family [Helianthus annuus]KAJ0942834.1 putative transcription factor B3-Domain family [Helianthus annuus]